MGTIVDEFLKLLFTSTGDAMVPQTVIGLFPISLLLLTRIEFCSGPERQAQEAGFTEQRLEMVRTQIADRGITDSLVLHAMRTVPRHQFVPENVLSAAYEDHPLSIGHGQTISQPYIVALMTDLLRPRKGMNVLEIGTGSGYQAAVLAEIVGSVFTIEIVQPLAEGAQERLKVLGYTNVHVRAGDGYRGWPEHAPYDGIIVTAAVNHIPQPLIDQLAEGGRMVLPEGEPYGVQRLILVVKNDGKTTIDEILPVRFVPLTREP
jgi:protein-L-isoaspartate(D-aspartate) O-methyltransferase